MALNESPSEKEGKFALSADLSPIGLAPSMKVPPKRKGNLPFTQTLHALDSTLNESPSEKEGKFGATPTNEFRLPGPSMKVPPKRKGNSSKSRVERARRSAPSMKVPPKRKGNSR